MLETLDQEPIKKVEFDLSSSVSRAHAHTPASGSSSSAQTEYPLTFPVQMKSRFLDPELEVAVGNFLTQ